MLMEPRPNFLAATAVLKLPPKGSKTTSPSLLDALMNNSNNWTGIWHGWGFFFFFTF